MGTVCIGVEPSGNQGSGALGQNVLYGNDSTRRSNMNTITVVQVFKASKDGVCESYKRCGLVDQMYDPINVHLRAPRHTVP